MLFTYYFTISSFIKVKIREIITNAIDLDKIDIGVSNTKASNSNFIDYSQVSSNDGYYKLSNEIDETNKIDTKKDGKIGYLYWALIILGICTAAGVGYWYIFSGSNNDPGQKPGAGTPINSEIIKEIEKTQDLKEKFNIWSYIQNMGCCASKEYIRNKPPYKQNPL